MLTLFLWKKTDVNLSNVNIGFLQNRCQLMHIIYNYATVFMLTLVLPKTDVNLMMLNLHFLVMYMALNGRSKSLSMLSYMTMFPFLSF